MRRASITRDGANKVRGTSDLGDMLASTTNRPPTTDVAVAAARYDAATLRTVEEARDRAQQVRVAELRHASSTAALTMPALGSGTSDITGSVGIPGVEDRVRIHAFRSMGPSQRRRRRLACCRWGHAVLYRLRGRSKGPPCRGMAGAPR